MRRIVAGLVVLALVALFVTPTPAFAGGRWRHGGRGGHGGYVVGGLAVGALTGLVLGGILASRPAVVYEPAPVYAPPAPVYQPAPVYVQPAPVYVAPPPPVCSDYWLPDGYRHGVWVQGHWERACR